VTAWQSGYYAWLARPRSARALADEVFTMEIIDVHTTSRRNYGAPRVHAVLRDRGVRIGRKRVARLMRRAGICGAYRRRKGRTTVVERSEAPAPDLLERTFKADGPDRLWLADITYVLTWVGCLYLAVVLDCFTRRVVGWAMREDLRTELLLEAWTWPCGIAVRTKA
jgi:putative transposase